MSAYSTLYITRSRAKAEFVKKILGDIPDEDLERFLDIMLEPRLYNAIVVPDGYADPDDAEAFDGACYNE